MANANPFVVTPPAPPPVPQQTDDIRKCVDGLEYPLILSFKLLALASQVSVTDTKGRAVLYTRQKLLKFKEHVELWTDSSREVKLADIKASKIIDWSARYFFTDANGGEIGSVGRRGWRSLWKARYDVFNPGDQTPDFTIQEANPWSKVFDSMLGEIPILGMFCGYFFHPRYEAKRADGTVVMRLTKMSAFFGGRFGIEKTADLSPREELNLFLSFLMLVLLERRRG